MVSAVWSLSLLLFFYSRCSMCPAIIVKVGGGQWRSNSVRRAVQCAWAHFCGAPRRTLCEKEGALLESLHTGPLQPCYAIGKHVPPCPMESEPLLAKGHFEGKRIGKSFPLLNCLRTHYGRHCEPPSGQKRTGLHYCIYISFFCSVIIPLNPHRSAPGAWTQTLISASVSNVPV